MSEDCQVLVSLVLIYLSPDMADNQELRKLIPVVIKVGDAQAEGQWFTWQLNV